MVHAIGHCVVAVHLLATPVLGVVAEHASSRLWKEPSENLLPAKRDKGISHQAAHLHPSNHRASLTMGTSPLPQPAGTAQQTPSPEMPWSNPEMSKKLHKMMADFIQQMDPLLLTPLLIGFALLILLALSFFDCTPGKHDVIVDSDEPLQLWSTAGMVALTSFRFYTGFLNSTWMPYLLAMEGQALMEDRQSFFMGSAKLIYGASIVLNPLFGLVGDEMAGVSHWTGRRLFILAGVGSAGLGIYGCMFASATKNVVYYFVGTVLWMVGEAIADVTTETLVPELLPKSQYEVAASIRSLHFLLGGLVGYCLLVVGRTWDFSWLYGAYLVLMFVCAFMTLLFINVGEKERINTAPRRREASLGSLLSHAYLKPPTYEGGFPRCCLCQFLFSLGTSPMFFLLLIVRDVVGISGKTQIQLHFGFISIAFFVAAAAASILQPSVSDSAGADSPAAPSGPEAGAGGREVTEHASRDQRLLLRWRLMVIATCVFGGIVFLIPCVGLLHQVLTRLVVFYIMAVAFGFSFGAVYARFQECTWSVLPTEIDIANAMGFAAMCKLAGVGLGNFLAGVILDEHAANDHYNLLGYAMLCGFSAIVVFLAAGLAHTIGQMTITKANANVCVLPGKTE